MIWVFGKTIQILSVIVDYVQKNRENRKASLVVSPSSLSLNWQNEATKFADGLKTLVIRGTLAERKEKIKAKSLFRIMLKTSYGIYHRFYIVRRNISPN